MTTLRRLVGARIREARETDGLSQTEVGQAMRRQRTHAAISEMEHGKVKIDIEELAELADLFNRDLSWFVADEVGPYGRIVPFGDDQ